MKRLAAVLFIAASAASGVSGAASAPDAGRPFEVTVHSEPIYGIKRSGEDPARQRHYITAADGTQLFLETWLPKAKNGNIPPERMPTILAITPYQKLGSLEEPFLMPQIVPRGYAYSQLHVRGTGESTGCMRMIDGVEADDGARAIEYLGRDAPWSNGVVGGTGLSYPGGSILNAAARGDHSKTQYLKAIWAMAPLADMYDGRWIFDGVPSLGVNQASPAIYFEYSLTLGGTPTPEQLAEKALCQAPHFLSGADDSGNVTPWYRERDMRPYLDNIRVAVFISQGHADLTPNGGVPPSAEVGLFDRLPADIRKVGMFGVFGHEEPSHRYVNVRTAWTRPDFDDMRIAWFDQYLKGIDSGVDDWPVAQVQGTDGQWRTEPDWPTTGGPVGQLALGPSGKLGVAGPSGATAYVEGPQETTATGFLPGTASVFETAPLPERLELAGQPILDLWVVLDRPDAHIASRLETFDANGEPITAGLTYGLRSAQHLDPLVDNRFVQTKAKLPPTGVPINIPVRFQPTDLVIPKGGTLRLTIAGTLIINPGASQLGIPEPLILGPSQPSFTFSRVSVVHDCSHPSTLRFLMPRVHPDLLNVREIDEPQDQPLDDNRPFVDPVSDAGGLATAPVCGAAPVRLENFGPAIP